MSRLPSFIAGAYDTQSNITNGYTFRKGNNINCNRYSRVICADYEKILFHSFVYIPKGALHIVINTFWN